MACMQGHSEGQALYEFGNKASPLAEFFTIFVPVNDVWASELGDVDTSDASQMAAVCFFPKEFTFCPTNLLMAPPNVVVSGALNPLQYQLI